MSKLPEVKAAILALRASVIGREVTVDEMMATMQRVADRYHSISTQSTFVAMMAAYGVAPQQPTVKAKKNRCWHWAKLNQVDVVMDRKLLYMLVVLFKCSTV